MDLTPDLPTFADGTPVSAGGSPRRRAELQAAFIPHEEATVNSLEKSDKKARSDG